MNIKNLLTAAAIAAATLFGLTTTTSCQEKSPIKGDAVQTQYTIEPYRKEFSFNFKAGSLKSAVTTNAPLWDVQTSWSWIHTEIVESHTDGRVLIVSVDENGGEEQRKGTFDLIAMDASGNEVARKTVEVIQNPKTGVIDGAILFEDSVFERLLLESYDRNSDQVLTMEEAETIISLDFENLGINSIEGVQYFKNLENLDVNQNNLKKIDVSGLKNLKYVHCEMNRISSLICNDCPKLQSIMAHSNELQEVDLSSLRESLQVLDLRQNKLTQADLSDMKVLIYAALGKNKMNSLNLSGCESLEIFSCNDNNLASLDLSSLTGVLNLDCSNNYLQELVLDKCTKLGLLNISGNTRISALNLVNCPIIHLNASNTGISGLTFKNPENVMTLRISQTAIKTFDFSPFLDLRTLECNGLSLDKVDVKANVKLEKFICTDSGLTAVDLTGKTKLKEVDVQDNAIGNLDLGDSPILEKINVKGNAGITLVLAKALENSSSLELKKDGDCTVTYR